MRLDDDRLAELPVPSSASAFLRVIQQRPRHPNIDNTSDIGDIDLHTQRTRGRDHLRLTLREPLQNRWLVDLLAVIHLALQFLSQLDYLLNGIGINNYLTTLLCRLPDSLPDKYQYRLAGKSHQPTGSIPHTVCHIGAAGTVLQYPDLIRLVFYTLQ